MASYCILQRLPRLQANICKRLALNPINPWNPSKDQCCRALVCSIHYQLHVHRERNLTKYSTARDRLCQPVPSFWLQRCHKSKKSRRSKVPEDNDEDESDLSDDEEIEKSKDSQVVKGHVTSTRIDSVLKFALGMSRNKVDNAFYSNSIYLSGERLDKKSHTLTIEDEIDVVRSVNDLNPAFLDISRVEVLDLHRSRDNPDKIVIKIRRFKRLTVDNYPTAWHPPSPE